jgi:glutamate formiminotransferase / 5-formyltetrahydrofolate cyclo-ligase
MTDRERRILECVVNVSEGRDEKVISTLAASAGRSLLDVHSDPDHHRSVFTLAGPPDEVQQAARSVALTAVSSIDIRRHSGAHPRIGALDVVPFVSLVGGPLHDGPLAVAIEARDAFARWAGRDLELPCFLYGPERQLPEVRKAAWSTLEPDTGPTSPHLSAGAAAVGARPALVAYNLWLAEAGLDDARRVAAAVRGPHLRTLGLATATAVQVSCNLIAPWEVGPGDAFDAVASRACVDRAELVGLVPLAVLDAEPRHRWEELGLSPSATIEARLERAGLGGGRFGDRDP